MEFAKRRGVNVVAFTSTSEAKGWISTNQDFLSQNDSGKHIRVISDNSRIELDPRTNGVFHNINAGETITRYLRGLLLQLPILIYCCASLPYTRYVESYTMAGSTTLDSVVEDYILSLSRRTSDDDDWIGFAVA